MNGEAAVKIVGEVNCSWDQFPELRHRNHGLCAKNTRLPQRRPRGMFCFCRRCAKATRWNGSCCRSERGFVVAISRLQEYAPEGW